MLSVCGFVINLYVKERDGFMKITKNLIYPKNIKRVILALITVLTIAFITMGAVNDVALKNVTLIQTDEFNGIDNKQQLNTRRITVGDFLEEYGIILEGNDIINMKLDDELSDKDVLIIRKGRLMELSVDGNTNTFMVTKASVGEALKELKVELSQADVVTPASDTFVTDNIKVTVDRYSTRYSIVAQAVDFETENVNDETLEKGKSVVEQNGSEGLKEVMYATVYKNGEEISSDIVAQKVTKEPVNKIVKIGTKEIASNTNPSKGFAYSKVISVSATAYDCSLQENGGYSKTAYGLKPGYGIVAVDPKVIPLGTKLYIESPDGGKSWTYGYCIAGDTGGAIKGNKVDLCFNTYKECIKFGRRSATVYVLD